MDVYWYINPIAKHEVNSFIIQRVRLALGVSAILIDSTVPQQQRGITDVLVGYNPAIHGTFTENAGKAINAVLKTITSK